MKKLLAVLSMASMLTVSGCDLLTGHSSDDGDAGRTAAAFEKPACLEQKNYQGAEVLVLCGTDGIFTYLVAPEITANFTKGGFDITPYIMYGPAVNVEGIEVEISSHPRAGRSPLNSTLGPEGGFATADPSCIYVRARSFVTDQQGHRFETEYATGVKYSN